MTYHSKNVIERLKRTLFKYDMEIARVEGEIALAREKIDLYSQSTKKTDLRELTSAKIDKDNYEVFLSRLKTNKLAILRNVYTVVDKYEGEYAEVFKKFYFENRNVEDISSETNIPIIKVKQIIKQIGRAHV